MLNNTNAHIDLLKTLKATADVLELEGVLDKQDARQIRATAQAKIDVLK